MNQISFSSYASKTAEEIYTALDSSQNGLSEKEAKQRLCKHHKKNRAENEGLGMRLIIRQFTSPFVYLLIAAMLIAAVLGDFVNAAMIFVFIAINAALGFWQEYHSERSLALLNRFIAQTARVIRNGAEKTIDKEELVKGDLMIIRPGDALYADLRFVATEHLLIDESALSGESMPVEKNFAPILKPVEDIYAAGNIGFAGTVVVRGEGRGIVIAVSEDTVMGEIERVARTVPRKSSFERSISRLSAFVLRLTLITLAFVFIANLAIKGGRTDMGALLVFSIALAVTVIPEALPLVMTFSLSRGALKLAKNKVVVKRLSAIEDLGGIEILCTDKTGTLTENKMTVHEARPLSDNGENACKRLLMYGTIGSRAFPKGAAVLSRDAFEQACFAKISDETKKESALYAVVSEIPFDPERRRATFLVERNGKRGLIVRGAPEEVLHKTRNFTDEEKSAFDEWILSEGRSGRRVLAISKKDVLKDGELEAMEDGSEFMGFISFFDPLKPSADEAIAKARRLGVSVKILTGDSPEVASSVAREIGLIKGDHEVITGKAFDALSLSEQKKAASLYSVFARVTPLQKYKIVEFLQAEHEVGFLGEGINDAPALKISNVAIVVHDALPSAREQADIVLLKKSLNVIIDGIEEGRVVFANTVKYIKATLASNFGNFYAVAIASLLVDFLPMLPLQILLVNLLSDFPMIAISADTVDKRELRYPKRYDLKDIALLATILGVVSSVFDFIFFGLFYRLGASVLQTNWFVASILTELVFLFSIRTRGFFVRASRPSLLLTALSVLAGIATVAIPFTSFGREVFHFIPPSGTHLAWIIGLLLFYLAITEAVKLFYYRSLHGENN